MRAITLGALVHPRNVQGLEKKIVISAAAGGQFSVVLTESNKVGNLAGLTRSFLPVPDLSACLCTSVTAACTRLCFHRPVLIAVSDSAIV